MTDKRFRITKWEEYVDCKRSVPFTTDGECDGRVRVHGYAYPASKDGPAGGISSVDACDRCGYAEWSAEEIHEMEQEARGTK